MALTSKGNTSALLVDFVHLLLLTASVHVLPTEYQMYDHSQKAIKMFGGCFCF